LAYAVDGLLLLGLGPGLDSVEDGAIGASQSPAIVSLCDYIPLSVIYQAGWLAGYLVQCLTRVLPFLALDGSRLLTSSALFLTLT
jgi:hypothetical protein